MTTPGWGPPDGPAGGLVGPYGFSAGETRHFQVFYRELPHGACTQDQATSQRITVTMVP